MPEINFLPPKEADLLAWSLNFATRIAATPIVYAVSAAQAAAYGTLHDTFAAALQAATEPGTRTKPSIQAKNDAKTALLDGPNGARSLARIIQAAPAVTNEQKALLGLTVRDSEPTPVPPPEFPPDIAILSVLNRTVKVRLRDIENPDRRGKPDGVKGATVFYSVGDDAPSDPAEWSFAFNTTRTVFDVDFPQTVAAGAKVWLTAFWYNTKAQSSPPASYVSTRFSDGMAQAA
jgi:hypothetical protein